MDFPPLPPVVACHCCGRTGRYLWGLDGGRKIHADCWDEHHSDPATEWPVGHICKGALRGTD